VVLVHTPPILCEYISTHGAEIHVVPVQLSTVTFMRASRRVLAASVLLVLSAGVILGVKALPEQSLATRLAGCVPAATYENPSITTDVNEKCITNALTEAVVSNQVTSIVPVLEQLNTQVPGLCHRAAHAAGSAAWPRDGSWIRVISKVNFPQCSSGLLHGLVDNIALKQFSKQQWLEFTRWCDAQFGNYGVPNCGDATGHVAWMATKDRVESLAICDMFNQERWRGECTEGIVMQEHDPASSKVTVKKLPEDATLICNHINIDDKRNLRYGCVRGVAFILGKNIGHLESSEKYDQESIDRVKEALSTCDQFERSLRDVCAIRFYDMLRFRFPPDNSFVDNMYCTVRKSLEAECRAIFAAKR